MSAWTATQDLAEILADELFQGREDSRKASTDVANAIHDLIEAVVEEKTGAA